jgi:hypothetical protein
MRIRLWIRIPNTDLKSSVDAKFPSCICDMESGFHEGFKIFGGYCIDNNWKEGILKKSFRCLKQYLTAGCGRFSLPVLFIYIFPVLWIFIEFGRLILDTDPH